MMIISNYQVNKIPMTKGMRKILVKSSNSITIEAKNKKEAFEKAIELLESTNIKDLELNNITKNYVIIDLGNDKVFNKNNRRCLDE